MSSRRKSTVEPLTQRPRILNLIRQRMEYLFGPRGNVDKIFRGVSRGSLRHRSVVPWCTVDDMGQSLAGMEDGESEDRALRVRLWLHIAGTWEDVDDHIDWSDRVEVIVRHFVNWLPDDTGGLRMKYIEDGAFDCMLQSGKTQAVWPIDMEYRYFTEIHGAEDWNE